MDYNYIFYISLTLIYTGTFFYFKQFIKNEFQKQVEDYKWELINRHKAEKVAELFSRIHYKSSDNYETSKLVWELSFYLPKELVCKLTETLVKGSKSAKDIMPLFIQIREHLGIKDGLTWDNVAYIGHSTQTIEKSNHPKDK